MTAVARALQAVKPHIPMIKFPDRFGAIKSGTRAMASPQGAPPQTSQPSSQSQTQSPAMQTYQKPVGYLPRGSGGEYHTLPERYHRLPISQEEMEYIERGGPDS